VLPQSEERAFDGLSPGNAMVTRRLVAI